jgi:hypothetical protein
MMELFPGTVSLQTQSDKHLHPVFGFRRRLPDGHGTPALIPLGF